MKNIQVIDGADNCTFPVFQVTDDEFALIFPDPGQDIQFSEDLDERALQALIPAWNRPIMKTNAMGIHGTLFYHFDEKRQYFPKTKRERDWNPSCIRACLSGLLCAWSPSDLLVITEAAWQGGAEERDVDQGASGAA